MQQRSNCFANSIVMQCQKIQFRTITSSVGDAKVSAPYAYGCVGVGILMHTLEAITQLVE